MKCDGCGIDMTKENSTLDEKFCDVCFTRHAKSMFF